jgi:hypothetical protein
VGDPSFSLSVSHLPLSLSPPSSPIKFSLSAEREKPEFVREEGKEDEDLKEERKATSQLGSHSYGRVGCVVLLVSCALVWRRRRDHTHNTSHITHHTPHTTQHTSERKKRMKSKEH